jgi:DedD protein
MPSASKHDVPDGDAALGSGPKAETPTLAKPVTEAPHLSRSVEQNAVPKTESRHGPTTRKSLSAGTDRAAITVTERPGRTGDLQPAAAAAGARPEPQPAPDHRQVWMVQMGTFNDERNARALAERLTARGFTTRVDKIAAKQAQAYRVRVGPAASPEAARALQGRLALATGLRGVVVAR